MTEDEAKTKWCPFGRIMAANDAGDFHPGLPAYNRVVVAGTDKAVGRCIGSDCMAWRFVESAEFKSKAEAAFRRSGERLSPGPGDVDGRCGLAGATQ